MKALIIGGHRNGEFVDVLDGAQVWVDIRTATTHRLRQITNTVTMPEPDGKIRVTEAHTITLAVHQDILGPDEPQTVQAMLTNLALNAFTREHGVHHEIPKEPAAADLTLPGGDGR